MDSALPILLKRKLWYKKTKSQQLCSPEIINILVQPGVKQSGVCSNHMYQFYQCHLLMQITESYVGTKIATTSVSSSTCVWWLNTFIAPNIHNSRSRPASQRSMLVPTGAPPCQTHVDITSVMISAWTPNTPEQLRFWTIHCISIWKLLPDIFIYVNKTTTNHPDTDCQKTLLVNTLWLMSENLKKM